MCSSDLNTLSATQNRLKAGQLTKLFQPTSNTSIYAKVAIDEGLGFQELFVKCCPVSTTPSPVTLMADVAVNKASVIESPVTEKTGKVNSTAEGSNTPRKLSNIIRGSLPLAFSRLPSGA